MILSEFYAYKTQFAFAKNDVDTLFFKDITPVNWADPKNLNLNDVFKAYEGTPNSMLTLKTKYGWFIKLNFKSNNFVKYFLIHNSSNFCAAFTSQRVSDCYMFAYAEGGQLKRFFSVEDGEVISEGTKSVYEKGVKHKLVKPNDEQISEVDEADILTCIKNCVGFDVETEDVEILECKLWVYEGVLAQIPQDVALNICNNLNTQGYETGSVCFYKSHKIKNVLILAEVNGDFIYSYACKKSFAYEDFILGYHTALNCLADFNFQNAFYSNNFNEESRLFLDLRFLKSIGFNMDNIVSLTFCANESQDATIMLTKLGKTYVDKNLAEHNGDILENYFPPRDDKLVYKFVKKNIGRKRFKTSGQWNLQV